ncbi:MAG TPA: 5-(carboxyamino)imidazole ribonucleotide mutase [Deltaproteobacteria bacterium]|nr:5-(carboxyamino)imidazole ribonucleotide mutase [Deltaproteobacteria bacterium]HBG73266.1 5-(carboxyamino)imidazole ribonucleotide mutase [Deltaproteobacteria bacterium]
MMAGKVLILMGSASDAETMRAAAEVLSGYGIPCEMTVASAHRSPARTQSLARNAEKAGFSVIIAGAGAAAHLAGCVAAETVLPVIGVPLAGSPLGGLDALLATAQMPAGVPVATVAVGKAGAQNAGHLAAQILSLSSPKLRARIRAVRKAMAVAVEEAAKRLP